MKAYQTQSFGKWILAGEHSVLRGYPALAFPLLNRTLDLSYEPGPGNLEVQFFGQHGNELNLLFYGVIENALARLKVRDPLKGKFILRSDLPVGAGLGASAALCGAVARWCEAQDWIARDDVYEFARSLEDLFHGESSGVDLAVSLSAKGIRFVRGQEYQTLNPQWWPKFCLSYSGHRGMTSDCVSLVKKFIEADPKRGEQVDREMGRAVELAQFSLEKSEKDGFESMKQSITTARRCFEDWGLCTGDLIKHMRSLEDAGAIAVKPTGSGGGGFVLSMWANSAPASLETHLVPVPRPL